LAGIELYFEVLSRISSVFKHFYGPLIFKTELKHSKGFLKQAINPAFVIITQPES